MPQVDSRTIQIDFLPERHTIENLNQMFEDISDNWDPEYSNEPDGIVFQQDMGWGSALVQFNSVRLAQWAASYWNHRVWKEAEHGLVIWFASPRPVFNMFNLFISPLLKHMLL